MLTISTSHREQNRYHLFMPLSLATARHNVDPPDGSYRGTLYARVNTQNGGATFIQLPPKDDWRYSSRPQDGTDVAITPFEWSVPDLDCKTIGVAMFAGDAIIDQYKIGVGDELAISGLFTRREGIGRNLPIVRSGIIAAMPDEPLINDAGDTYRAYLAEVRSIGGLSGSPVFVQPSTMYNGVVIGGQHLFLLGLVRGHFDYKAMRSSLDYSSTELEQVNMGISIITPAHDVLEVLNSDELARVRRGIERDILTRRSESEAPE